MNKIAQKQNIIKVDASYNKSNQGIVITFTIPVDYDQVTNILKMSTMLVEFIMGNFKEFFKKYEFCTKFNTPMIIGEEQRLRLYMCFVGQNKKQIEEQLKKLGIQERNYI